MWWAQGSPGSDVEDYIADLVNQGWDDEGIAEERRVAEELMEPRHIWPENWAVVEVFCRCTWTRLAGFKDLIWIGISAQEVLAAMHSAHVPRKDWPEVSSGVAVMVNAALPHLNAEKDN